MKLFKVIILFCICFNLFSCSKDIKIGESLKYAEYLMQQRPDSALLILKELNPEVISSKRCLAKYSLLLSQAKDKNYIDEVSDSLISIAVSYYDKTDEYYNIFRSYYYLGRVQYNSGNMAKALLSYSLAEQFVDKIDDYYAVGLLYAQMGIIYKRVYDFDRSLDAFLKSYFFYNKSNKEILQMYSLINIGQVYYDMKNYHEAERYIEKAMFMAENNNEYAIVKSCVKNLLPLYEDQGKILSMKKLISKIDESRSEDLIILQSKAYVSLFEDELQSKKYIARAWNYAKTTSDTLILYNKEYKIYKEIGDNYNALLSLEKLFRKQDQIIRHQLQQPLYVIQKDYFQSQSDYNELKLEHNKKILIFVACFSILLLILLYVYIKYKIILKNKQINDYIEKVYNLENVLLVKNNDCKEKNDEILSMHVHINNLFIKQFNLIDKLCITYYETHGINRDKEAIYLQVKKEIDMLRDSKSYYMQIENIVNQYKYNVIKLIRIDFPSTKESDIRLLCFMYAGFSAKAISVFTDDSVGNIYMKKSRLKSKILNSNSLNKDMFISLLSYQE